MSERAQILIRHAVDLKVFREEIMPASEPVVLKGLVNDWPAVRAARESARALGICAASIVANPSQYSKARRPFTGTSSIATTCARCFERRPASIGDTIERLLAQFDYPNPPALYIESTSTAEHLPPFAGDNPHPLLPPTIAPRIWIGNTLLVQLHFDLSSNIACVVGGRRRFTLFPLDQVANLYVGPFEFNVSGLPIGMVTVNSPDLARFPRFAEALRHARSAELEPGDAIYIPYGWWHQVESLTPFNVLVNYWWNDARQAGSPFDCMLHAMHTLRDLPPHRAG